MKAVHSRTVYLVVPDGVDDVARPSGGNTYDRKVRDALTRGGWEVREHVASGAWPNPVTADLARLESTVAQLDDGAVVIVDGLIASVAPEVLVPAADRVRVAVLVHMPIGPAGDSAAAREKSVLSAASAVIATSHWTRRWLLNEYGIDPARVHVAEPGTERADLAAGTSAGTALLCVAAVVPHKGQDVLLSALASLAELPWQCVFAGALDLDPAFVSVLRRRATATGIADRVTFVGPLTGPHLGRAYAEADVLVHPARIETFGMVVTEASARGLPVIASEVGGVPEALGHATDGSLPGRLVAPGDPSALAAALREWLCDAQTRKAMRSAARSRRLTLPDWELTADRIAAVVTTLADHEEG